MKFFFLIIFLCLSIVSFSQKRSNKKRIQFPEKYFIEEMYYYDLLDSTHFFFTTAHFCGSAPTGRGTYKINGDSITFTFTKFPGPEELSKITYFENEENNDSIYIRITCYEDSVNVFPYININYKNKSGSSIRKQSDINGVAELKIKTDDFKDTIYFSMIGMPQYKLPVQRKNQDIKMQILVHHPFEVYDRVVTHKIDKRNRKLITCKKE